MEWHQAILDAGDPNREEPEDWDPPDNLARSWAVWCLLSASGWKHLPAKGGLLDQPEELMHDIATIEWLSSIVGPEVERKHKPRE